LFERHQTLWWRRWFFADDVHLTHLAGVRLRAPAERRKLIENA